jgi:molybdopterin-containing oxidoreductase family membrane subunit
LPIQDTRFDWIRYSGTWVEWSLTLAGIAVFCLLFMIASKLVPIIAVSELTEKEEHKKIDQVETFLG